MWYVQKEERGHFSRSKALNIYIVYLSFVASFFVASVLYCKYH